MCMRVYQLSPYSRCHQDWVYYIFNMPDFLLSYNIRATRVWQWLIILYPWTSEPSVLVYGVCGTLKLLMVYGHLLNLEHQC